MVGKQMFVLSLREVFLSSSWCEPLISIPVGSSGEVDTKQNRTFPEAAGS